MTHKVNTFFSIDQIFLQKKLTPPTFYAFLGIFLTQCVIFWNEYALFVMVHTFPPVPRASAHSSRRICNLIHYKRDEIFKIRGKMRKATRPCISLPSTSHLPYHNLPTRPPLHLNTTPTLPPPRSIKSNTIVIPL